MAKRMDKIKINKYKRVFQILLWVLVLFVITRGVFSFMRKDESKAIKESIKEMANSQDKKRLVELNAVSFAEGFTRAFVEFDGDETAYKSNISKYIPIDFKLSGNTINSEVIDIIPTKSEWIGDKKILVDCVAKVKFGEKVNVSPSLTVKPSGTPSASSTGTPSSTQTTPKPQNSGNKIAEICLRVPVSVNSDGFLVESNPLFVANETKSTQRSEIEDEGEIVRDEGIKEIVKSFITAYCRGDGTELSYYTLPDGLKIKGLGNNFTFKEIDKFDLKKNGDKYFANVTYVVESSTGTYLQGMQIVFVLKDKKYLIEKLNTVIK